MTVVNEVCGAEGSKTKNTGGKKQRLEGAVRTYALAKGNFTFESIKDAKSKEKWDEAKQNKDIVIFYDIEELEVNNREEQITEGRYSDYKSKDAIKGVNYTHYLSSCSYEALKSFESSEYNRVFRITENNELLCVVKDDGKVQGEPLNSFLVGIRNDAPADGVPNCQVMLKFNPYKLSVLKPEFDMSDYEGIYDVRLELVSATATSIKFKAMAVCSCNAIKSFEESNVVVKDASGAVETVSFVSPDPDGVYEITGTDFANGYELDLDGVIAQTEIMYESEAPLSIQLD
ncbi:hypothetical protein [Psychroflexus aestuariivivens]|uniref:hypothetical protein n=1 Tax=Psychroflexus aestuariivivens TaxID=1795040 RepID=UPI000FD9E3EF|nr:hypothetical protein [Psychroflexus aestuariivivens]